MCEGTTRRIQEVVTEGEEQLRQWSFDNEHKEGNEPFFPRYPADCFTGASRSERVCVVHWQERNGTSIQGERNLGPTQPYFQKFLKFPENDFGEVSVTVELPPEVTQPWPKHCGHAKN